MGEVTKLCINKGFLIEPQLAGILENLYSDNQELTKEILNFLFSGKQKILTQTIVYSNADNINLLLKNISEHAPGKTEEINAYSKHIYEYFQLKQVSMVEDAKREVKIEVKQMTPVSSDLRIVSSYTLPGKKIQVEDFVKYFRTRFLSLKAILQERTELQNLASINKISGNKQNLSVIAIVLNKRMSKNKNLILEVEDLTGRATLLVNASKPEVFSKAVDIVVDDVLGFKCSGNNEILFVNDVIFPDAKLPEKKKIEKEGYALFLSDIHVGSTRFKEQEFSRFIKWINAEIGNHEQKEMARKVKYLFCAGDLIDGIGIYPSQEDELAIKDVYGQYDKLAELLEKIRGDVKIILSPGNHDAVRIAEPQPLLDEKFAAPLYSMPNTYFVSNPSMVNIAGSEKSSGLNVLMYHGYSYDHFINSVDSLRLGGAYKRPELIMNFLLKRRHLAPSHASTLYFPYDKKDPLLIAEVPDVFVSGHIHKSGVSTYNNIVTISCSCWQGKTPFQERMGHEPDYSKIPMLNLQTREVGMIDFSE